MFSIASAESIVVSRRLDQQRLATLEGSFWSRTGERSASARNSLTPVSCYYQTMAKRIPPDVLEYLRKMGQAYGSQGG